ncbi:MAG: hypothetical protein EOO07_33935 [Chitinophagaceae bacterium]|nr:MAG: hypothetical protein EOO07_33935 [Chitinophagaceae bacterium]
MVLRASGGEEILDAVSDAEAGVIYYQNYQINIDTNLINANGNVNELDALNSSGNETNAVFSQDEKEIYFVSNRTGYAELWNYDIHTKRVKQITDLKALSIIGPIISHDQTRFVLEYRTDNLYIGIFDKDTGKLIVNSQIPSHRFPLSWSRDNNYIYVSEHEAQVNLFRYNVSNLEFSVVAKNAGLFARESMDGKKLVYVDYDSGGLIEYELVNKSSASLGSLIENLAALSPGQFRLSKDWTAMYVLRNDHNTPHLLSKSLMPTGTRSDIRTIELPELAWVTDINNTGTQILFLQHKPPSGDIMKIELR